MCCEREVPAMMAEVMSPLGAWSPRGRRGLPTGIVPTLQVGGSEFVLGVGEIH